MANPQPIVVHAHGGALTPEGTFYLDAGCIVVTSTAFLAWEPAPAVGGGPPRAGLGTSQLLYAFGAKLRSATAPAAVAAVTNHGERHTPACIMSSCDVRHEDTIMRAEAMHLRQSTQSTRVHMHEVIA